MLSVISTFVEAATITWVAQMMGIEIFIAARDMKWALAGMRSQRVLRRV